MSDPEQSTDVMPSLDEVPIDDLDRKLLNVFAGRVVRKDLVKKLKVGFNVPVYVLEYLLGKFCSTTNREEIEAGLRQVKDTITERIVRADHKVGSKNGRPMFRLSVPANSTATVRLQFGMTEVRATPD